MQALMTSGDEANLLENCEIYRDMKIETIKAEKNSNSGISVK